MASYWIIVALLGGLGLGILGGWLLCNRLGAQSAAKAREQAERLLQDARSQSENLRKLELAKAREQWSAEREEMEQEYQKRLESVKNIERAMNRRDAQLQRVERELEGRDQGLAEREAALLADADALEGRREEFTALHEEYNQRLEKVAGLTVEEAKKQLVVNLKSEAEHEA